ncbi:amidohydrolase [Dasania marina]|uniref:amidohydrolase n=1 Tax=Dasania marina TaxID=471499 RepID=UPI00035E713C|nr:amidohydrolase [Dasania marina]
MNLKAFTAALPLPSLLITSLLITACGSPASPPADSADLILQGGQVYTLDPQQPWAEAVAIKQGKIIYVGDSAGAAAYKGSNTQLSELNGKMLLPAFQDSHIHPVSGGLAYGKCPLFGLKKLEAVLAAVADCVSQTPDDSPIFARGWGWEVFNGEQPHKQQLDAISSTRPIITKDTDGHTLWVNSAALQLAGITRSSQSPAGGAITKDKKTGEPTGTLMEGPAMKLVTDKLPAVTTGQVVDALRYTQNYLHGLGITAMQDANVNISGSNPNTTLDAYAQMRDSGELKLRVSAALGWNPGAGLDQIDNIIKARDNYSGGRLQANTVKFWADGIIETRTAYMLDPYSDAPDNRGFLMIPDKELVEGGRLLDAEGFQLHIHAIGDGTVRKALDVIENARKHNGKRDSRHLTAHTQIVHPDDIARFGQLDVIAGFSPYWAYADDYVLNINPPQLGPVRMGWMYPINSIQQSGGRIAFGSDWSVSTADPLLAIETAVTRISPHNGEDTPALIPKERISLAQAISAYTLGAAYANFLDQQTGSIQVGKYADLVVLSDNLFEVAPADISEAKVTATIMEGAVVYGELN